MNDLPQFLLFKRKNYAFCSSRHAKTNIEVFKNVDLNICAQTAISKVLNYKRYLN